MYDFICQSPCLSQTWCCNQAINHLTHWGRVTHICVDKLIIIGSDNGLSPDRCKMLQFSLKKMHVKMSSAKWRPSSFCLNVLTHWGLVTPCGIIQLGQHDSGNGLLPNSTKPLPEPMLTNRPCSIHPRAISQGMLQMSIILDTFISLKIAINITCIAGASSRGQWVSLVLHNSFSDTMRHLGDICPSPFMSVRLFQWYQMWGSFEDSSTDDKESLTQK